MKQLTFPKLLALLGLFSLVVAIPLLAFPLFTQQSPRQKVQTAAGVSSSAVLSRNVPAFASSGYAPATAANDDSYDTLWRSQGTPAWLAYDLAGVPAARRGKILVVWYNESYNYDHILNGSYAYNVPRDYTIEVNSGQGGGNPPNMGWVTVATVIGNHYHSRASVVDMMGNNWIRMHVTSVDGAAQNYDTSINMDIYDAHSGTADDWIFFGDSITAGAMGHETLSGVKSFAQLIHAQAPNNFPVQESGGIGGLTSAEGAKYMHEWLQLFPGKYVGVSYGTNDANGCVNADTFYKNYVTMVQAVLHAGKIPVVPRMPWGRTANIQSCGPALNARIDAVLKAFPQVLKGPDLWAFFKNDQTLISNDNLHPTDAGFAAYRQQWANAMLKAVY